MRIFLAALMLATLAGLTIVSTGGCARTIDNSGPGRAGVVFISGGRLLPDSSLDVLKIADERTRLRQFDERSVCLEGVFVVPRRTFEWLFKQAAELRQLREDAVDN